MDASSYTAILVEEKPGSQDDAKRKEREEELDSASGYSAESRLNGFLVKELLQVGNHAGKAGFGLFHVGLSVLPLARHSQVDGRHSHDSFRGEECIVECGIIGNELSVHHAGSFTEDGLFLRLDPQRMA